MSREYLIVAVVVLVGFLALLFLKTGSHKTGHTMAASGTVMVVAKDYSFNMPATLPAGITTLRFVNKGKELHHATLLKIGEGHTLADLDAALKQPPSTPPPTWLTEAGGPNAVIGKDMAEVTLDLEPGMYVFICFIPGADGVPHFAKGMVKLLTVTTSDKPTAPEPVADVTMKLYDYGFELSGPVTPGKHTIRVENTGSQSHEFELVQFAPGKTLQDMIAWEEGGEKGPPPVARWLGGFAGIAPGGHGWVTMNFEAGEYALLCFLPDAKDGKSHIVHGMAQPLTVK